MNDAAYEVEKERVERLYDTWAKAMGLHADWIINVTYFRTPLDVRPIGDRKRPPECENVKYGRVMQVYCQWEYMTADVEVSCPLTARLDDRQLTEYFLHELGHLFLSGLANLHAGPSGKIGHAWYMLEEHTATRLAFAFLWLADEVWKSGLAGIFRREPPPLPPWPLPDELVHLRASTDSR